MCKKGVARNGSIYQLITHDYEIPHSDTIKMVKKGYTAKLLLKVFVFIKLK